MMMKYFTWADLAMTKAVGDKVKEKMVQISYQAYCKLHEIEELLKDVPVDRRDEYLSFAKETLRWMYAAAKKEDNK